MATNHDTLIRQWHMLRAIPRYPLKVTASQLKDKLDRDDFKITKRTVERDLLELSLVFPLVLDNRSKPYGWSWQKDAPAFDLPGLSNHEALTFMLVEQHLGQFMPISTQEVMAPYFKAARKILDGMPRSRRFGSWANKVRSVPTAQPLIAPPIKSEVQIAVTDALLHDKQLAITYQSRNKDSSQHQVHPLALVQRGPITYLYVRFNDYENTRILAMHRITRADVLDMAARPPKDFNLNHEIDKGRFGFGEGNEIQVTLRFSPEAGEHLYETPLSKDQKIELQKDGSLLITATLADTPQLLWWILAMGAGVEVIKPAALRTKVEKILIEASKAYRK